MGNPRPRAQWQKEWPLLRQEAEYATIYSALVGQSEARGVVVIGEAGVGKTTLARLCTESLPSRVQWVMGTQTTRSIPLGVFAHFVGSTAPREPVALLAAARKAILAQRDCVLCVDDAHLLDQLSATLLHRLAMDGCGTATSATAAASLQD